MAWSLLRSYLLSVHLQLGVQLAVATLLAGLPTFVKVLNFPHACFAPVLSTICIVSMSPDGHLGTKARAAAALLGETWLGAAAAGAAVSVAQPLQGSRPSAYLSVLCVSSSVGIAALAAPRAGPASLTLWPNITVSSLVFCVTVLNGQHSQSPGQLWSHAVGALCLAGATAAVAVLAAAALVLPSAASEEAVRLALLVVRGAGHSMTRYLSLLLDTTPPVQQPVAAGGAHGAAAAAAAPAGPADVTAEAHAELQPVKTTHTAAAAAAVGLVPAGSAAQEVLQVVSADPGSPLRSSGSNLHNTTVSSSMVGTTTSANATTASYSSSSSSEVDEGSSSEGFSSASNIMPTGQDNYGTMDSSGNRGNSREETAAPRATGASGAQPAVPATPAAAAAAAAGGHPFRRSSVASLLFEDALEQGASPEAEAGVVLVPALPGHGGSSSMRQSWLGSNHSHIHQQQQQQQQQQHMRRHPGQEEHVDTAAGQPGQQLQGTSQHARHAKRQGLGSWKGRHGSKGQQQQADEQQQDDVRNGDQHHQRKHHSHHRHHQNHHPRQLQLQHHRGPQALAALARHGHGGVQRIHAVTLHTPAGPVTLLGPSVDELRPLLLRAQGCLSSAAAEPLWLNPWQAPAQANLQGWAAVLTAAEQLVSMMSALQDVLAHEACPSPRLLSPATALYPSAVSFSEAAGAVICMAVTSCADLSRALLLLLPPGALRPGQRASDAAAALAAAAAAFVDAGSSWDAARGELLQARGAALGQYWSAVMSAKHVRVARHGQVLPAMFVWVLLEGLLQAVQAMEAAGLQLLEAAAAAQPGSSSSSSSAAAAVADAEAQPVAQQPQQQQQQAHGHDAAAKQSVAALKEFGIAVAMLPMLRNLAAIVRMASSAAYKALTSCCGGAAGNRHQHNVKQLQQQQQQQQSAWLSFTRSARAVAAAPAATWLRLGRRRDAAAAFKFWLCLSLLMALVMALSAGAGGGVHPAVVEGVMALPTHGVVAFVLAWHERVESTLIRVLLRILGTCAGSSIGYAAVALAPCSAPALLAMLCAFGVVLAPLASASLHLRFATALTFISAGVVVLCQFDAAQGCATASAGFYVGRIVQATVASLWAGASNHLLLPWSSGDWCRERLAGAYEAAVGLLADACELQLQAYRHLHQAAPAAAASDGCAADAEAGDGDVVLLVDAKRVPQQQQPAADAAEPQQCTDAAAGQLPLAQPHSQAELQARLQALRGSLQGKLVAPLVAVQKAVDAEVSVWHHHAPRGMAARSVKVLLRGMLELADRLVGLQATLAALPETNLQDIAGSSSGPAAAAAAGSDGVLQRLRRYSLGMRQQGEAAGDAAGGGPDDVAAARSDQLHVTSYKSYASKAGSDKRVAPKQESSGADAAAEGAGAASLRYLAGALMKPLHEAVAAQMVLLQAAAAAVKELLLLPHGKRVQVKAAAAAVGAAAADEAEAAVERPEQQLRGILQQLQQQRHSARELLVALRQAIHSELRQQQARQSAEGGAAAAAAGEGWWVSAGGHYMQQLAFDYALDKAVGQVAAVAEAALAEGGEGG